MLRAECGGRADHVHDTRTPGDVTLVSGSHACTMSGIVADYNDVWSWRR